MRIFLLSFFYLFLDQENSRLFAGRQIHPFFSSWKTGKKSQEPADSEHSLSEAKREGGRTTCDPTLVHVFEDVQVW